MTTDAYVTDQQGRTIELHDLHLIEEADTFIYSAVVDNIDIRFETVANPTARELLDAALHAVENDRLFELGRVLDSKSWVRDLVDRDGA